MFPTIYTEIINNFVISKSILVPNIYKTVSHLDEKIYELIIILQNDYF